MPSRTPRNANLRVSREKANDEWYTQLKDINEELYYYTNDREDMKIKNQFKNKIVFCNCDDPEWSDFWQYFQLNFKAIGLKKLISTHYEKDGKKSYMMEMALDKNGNTYTIKRDLKGNGDFRSDECVELLRQSDIIVTNPPFSCLNTKINPETQKEEIGYIELLIKENKKFLFIGPNNACHYSFLFPYIRDGKVWLGYNRQKGSMKFKTPDGKLEAKPSCWYTNLDCSYRHELLELPDNYYDNPDKYIKYENLENAIDVQKIDDIPGDWEGLIGVSDGILKKLNPEQFEVLGIGNGKLGQQAGVGSIKEEHKKKMKSHAAKGDLYYLLPDGTPKVPFSRIIVKLKNPRPHGEIK